MVQVAIHVRPKQGYHYPNKVDHLNIDSAERLESIQEKYNTTGSTTRLYYEGHELPLNSSIGSHNFDDDAILECCRSPAMSAALSACLKDLDEIKKLPTSERTRENLMFILQTPVEIRRASNNDIWQAKSWSEDSLKSRIINLATMKAVLQRQDRYHIHDLPHCNSCRSLHNALERHNVWKGGGQDQSKRNFLKQQAHIFKPEKNDGNPSTNWILLEEKLSIQQNIKSELSSGLRFSAGYDSPPVDWLEEFVRRDNARHGTRQNNSRRSNDAVRDTSDSHLEYLAPSPPRRRDTPPRPRQNESSATSPSGMTPSPTRSRRPYTPQYASGPFAVLATLHLAMHSRHRHSNGRRLLTLTEEQLKRMAQPMCRSNLYDKGRVRGRNAFACMDGLIEKQFVRKEIVRNTGANGGEIEKWGLLRGGEVLGELCVEFDRAVNQCIPIEQINSKLPGRSRMNLALCLDAREDVHLLKRMKWCCDDESVPYVEKEIPAGDYLFLDQSGMEEYVLPIVIERKSWSDLADSCLGKGRALNRLDCVKLESNSSMPCSGNCQLCKMKRCGCTQIMFIIEGERCLGSDSVHRSAKKCTHDKCCSACKLLSERHNVTQDVLERVLHRLQVEHGCYIHYTKSYNETIQSLFDMKQILEMNANRLRGESLTFDSYASNARQRSASKPDKLLLKPTSVQELNVEAMLPSVLSANWNLDTIRQHLLGTMTPGQENRSHNHRKSAQSSSSPSQTSDQAIALDEDVIELKDSTETDAGDCICIDLEESAKEVSEGLQDALRHRVRDSNARPKKRQKNEAICLDDSDSETESDLNKARSIRGGGDPYNCDDDDSDDDLFSNLSRFDKGRRKKLLERSYDIDSDSSDGLRQSSEKKKARRRRTLAKSSAPHAAKKSAPPRKNQGRTFSRASNNHSQHQAVNDDQQEAAWANYDRVHGSAHPNNAGTIMQPRRSKKQNRGQNEHQSRSNDFTNGGNSNNNSAAGRSPTTSSVAKKLPDVCLLSSSEDESQHDRPITIRKSPAPVPVFKTGEDDDDIVEVSKVRPPSSSRKRKASDMATDSTVTNYNERVYPLLVLHGWDEYDSKLVKRLDSVWKEIYSSTADSRHMNDLFTTSVTRLDDLAKESTSPFVRRKTLMKFVLWLQLSGVQIRSVQRMRFSDELKRCVGQSMNISSATRSLTSPAAYSHSLTRQPSAPVSTSAAAAVGSDDVSSQRKKSAMSVDRKRPASANRESDLIREARLMRFDKPTNHAVSSVDHRKKRPSKWSCGRCTLENSLDDEKCSACGGDSPMKQLPVAAHVKTWSCSSCTFENKAFDSNCSVCGDSKSVASAVASLSSNFQVEHLPNYSSSNSSKAAPNKRTVRCGACGTEGHNRANATEHNCPAYFDEKEVSRRDKIREKRQMTIADERDKIRAIEKESENADRMQAELARQIEELERNKERAEDFRKEELKRRKQKLKRLQKQQNK
ncbi:hypothetical protein ACHAXR_013214 [Thalassiosira sp. AJA248-18]